MKLIILIIISLTLSDAFIFKNLLLKPIHCSKHEVQNSWINIKSTLKYSFLKNNKRDTFIKLKATASKLPFDFESISYEEYLRRKEEEAQKRKLEKAFYFNRIDVGNQSLTEDAYYQHSQQIVTSFMVSTFSHFICLLFLLGYAIISL